MKKVMDCLSAALFFIFIVFFGAYTFLLADKPIDLDTSDIPASLEDYIEHNFPLADSWRSMYSTMITSAGQNRIGDVYVNERGMIELLSSTDEEKTQRNIDFYNQFSENHPNISCFALIAPTASGIYSQELPVVLTTVDQQKLIDDIYYRLDNSVQTLDAFNPLFSARDDYVYFRTDNSWTEYGAYTVYNKVIRKMGFSPIRLSSYDMEYADRDFYGDLYSKTYYNGTNADFINLFRNKNGSFVTGFSAWSGNHEFTSNSIYYSPALGGSHKLDVFLGGNSYEKYRITTSNTEGPKLLIIKGDYANMFVPFLTPHYSEIVLIDRKLLGDRTVEEAVNVEDFDQVLMLYDVRSFCGK